MPAVIDTPEVVEHEEYALYEEHDLYTEQPQVHVARSGFWHTVVQYVKRHRIHRLHGMPSSSYRPLHPIEMPADMLARQYPSLYIRAYAGV
jgi:hypothetical protein